MADLSSYIYIAANTVTAANVSATGNVVFNSAVSTTGNVTAGNIISGGVANITGNITGANLIAGSGGAGNVYAGNVIVNGQPTTYGYVNTTVVANTSPVETSINGGSSTSPALTVLTVAIPSAGTWRLDAELRVYVPGQGYMSAAFYDNGTLISGSEYFIAAGGVTQTGAATGQYGGFMSYNLTTTGARTVTLGIWSTTSSNCITSDDGRTWLRATLLNPSIAVQATATGTINNQYISVTNISNQTGSYGVKDIALDTVLGSSGIAYNTSTGVYTLTAGVPYRITSTIGFYNATPGYLVMAWVDATSNTPINSVTQTIANNNWPTGQIDPFTMDFVYTPVTNQTIKLRTTSTSNNTFELIGSGDSKVVIQQINNSFALNALATMSVTGNVAANNFIGNVVATTVSVSGNVSVNNTFTFSNIAQSSNTTPLVATDTTIAFKVPIVINGVTYYIALTAAQ